MPYGFLTWKLNTGDPYIVNRRIQIGISPSVARALVMSPKSVIRFQPKSCSNAR